MATTPNYQLPYPLPTAPVANGADDIKALAERLDSVVLPAQATDAEVAAAYIAKALADAKGDLLAATGPDAFGRLPVGADGKILAAQAAAATGLAWIDPPAGGGGGGGELGYAQITSPVSVTAGTESAGQTIVTAPPLALDGATAILVQFYSAQCSSPASAGHLVLTLWDGGTSLGTIGQIAPVGTAFVAIPVTVVRRLTPSAASHTYAIKAWLSQPGTGSVSAGVGGPGNHPPAFLRISRA